MSDSNHSLSRRQGLQKCGWLESRFSVEPPTDAPLSSGSSRVENPNLVVQNPWGTRRPSNDNDYNANAVAISETEKSDAVHSVVSVYDMGLSNRPALRLDNTDPFNLSHNIMDVAELRMYLDLEADSTASIEQSIRQKIERSLEKSKPEDQEYLPINAFNSIFSLEILKSLVKEKHPEMSEVHFNDRISQITGVQSDQSRLRVLGILLMMKSYDYIDHFIKEQVWDSDLPLSSPDENMEVAYTTDERCIHLDSVNSWGNDLILFLRYQWIFMVPFFDFRKRSLCYYDFKAQVRLPWRTFEYSDSGGNSSVYKLEMHPGHHNFPGSQVPAPTVVEPDHVC